MIYFMNDKVYYILLVGVTLACAFIISQIIRKILNKVVQNYSDKIKADPTNFSFINNSISFLIYSIAIFFIFIKIPFLKNLGTALFAGAGVLAAIIGFASQKAFSNIISGIFILIFKPFRVGDIIEVSSSKIGRVEEITLRHTTIRNFENRRIVIPNSIISDDTIVNSNLTDERIRKHIEIDVTYSSNLNKCMNIIEEVISNHPLLIDGRTDEEKNNSEPIILVKVISLTEYSVKIRAWVWANNSSDAFILQCDVLKSIKETFDKEEDVQLAFVEPSIALQR